MEKPLNSAVAMCESSELSFGDLKAKGMAAILIAAAILCLCLKVNQPNSVTV
jgi:hypothetical protein